MPDNRTKIKKLLDQKGLKQIDLVRLVKEKCGKDLKPDHISRIASGSVIDYYLRTACFIAQALEVTLTEVVEDEVLYAKAPGYEQP